MTSKFIDVEVIRHPVGCDGTMQFRFTFNVALHPDGMQLPDSLLGQRFREAMSAAFDSETNRLRNEDGKLKVAFGTSREDGMPLPDVDQPERIIRDWVAVAHDELPMLGLREWQALTGVDRATILDEVQRRCEPLIYGLSPERAAPVVPPSTSQEIGASVKAQIADGHLTRVLAALDGVDIPGAVDGDVASKVRALVAEYNAAKTDVVAQVKRRVCVLDETDRALVAAGAHGDGRTQSARVEEMAKRRDDLLVRISNERDAALQAVIDLRSRLNASEVASEHESGRRHPAELLRRAVDHACEHAFTKYGKIPTFGRANPKTHRLLSEVGGRIDVSVVRIDGTDHEVRDGDVIEINGIAILRSRTAVPDNTVELGFNYASGRVDIQVTCGTSIVDVDKNQPRKPSGDVERIEKLLNDGDIPEDGDVVSRVRVLVDHLQFTKRRLETCLQAKADMGWAGGVKLSTAADALKSIDAAIGKAHQLGDAMPGLASGDSAHAWSKLRQFLFEAKEWLARGIHDANRPRDAHQPERGV